MTHCPLLRPLQRQQSQQHRVSERSFVPESQIGSRIAALRSAHNCGHPRLRNPLCPRHLPHERSIVKQAYKGTKSPGQGGC